MSRNAFYSFHYKPDCERASQVRNMGALEGNQPVSDNDWETITKGGDPAIEKWIDGQMKGRSCEVVLIGSATAGRKWINYEIKKAWVDGKGVVGVYIHGLKNLAGLTATKGKNPFAEFTLSGKPMSDIVKAYDPTGLDSKAVYATIKNNLAGWVDEAIAIRKIN